MEVRGTYKGMSCEQASREAHRLMEKKLSHGGSMPDLVSALSELNLIMSKG